MKRVRWTPHALEALGEREIERAEAERTVSEPATVREAHGGRRLLARGYHDASLGRDMVLCVVTEETEEETVVVTCYRSSKREKFLRRGES